MTKPILRNTQQLGHYFRVSTLVGRIVGGLFSRDRRADRKETRRRQKDDATSLHRFKTQNADRARAAAALVSAARSRAEITASAVEPEQKDEASSQDLTGTRWQPDTLPGWIKAAHAARTGNQLAT
jgi:hypothetical protein